MIKNHSNNILVCRTLVMIVVSLFFWTFPCVAHSQDDFDSILGLIPKLESDSRKVSRKATEQLWDIFDPGETLYEWFEEDDYSKKFAKAAMPYLDDIKRLLKHPDSDIVVCGLEFMSRMGPAVSAESEILEEMLNDWHSYTPMIRMQVFRALCCVTPKNVSVFAKADDIGLVFDLNNMAALLRHDSGEMTTAFKYQGLVMTIGMQQLPFLRCTGHIESEIEVLSTHLDKKHPKIVRIFCMLVLAYFGPDAKKAVPHIEHALSDKDPEVRFLAWCTILNIDPNYEDEENILRKANLREIDEKRMKEFLQDLHEEKKKKKKALEKGKVK